MPAHFKITTGDELTAQFGVVKQGDQILYLEIATFDVLDGNGAQLVSMPDVPIYLISHIVPDDGSGYYLKDQDHMVAKFAEEWAKGTPLICMWAEHQDCDHLHLFRYAPAGTVIPEGQFFNGHGRKRDVDLPAELESVLADIFKMQQAKRGGSRNGGKPPIRH